jgi:hypothetical protein
VSGEGAGEFVRQLSARDVRVRQVGESFVVSASDVDTLTRTLRETPRPDGRLRLEVF